MTADLLDRIAERLAASRAAAGAPEGPLTIGDVYLRLIPYRSVRSELGILELAEYEHALLRLLSGERGHARLADPEVQAEIQRELDSVNPILGIYRDYPEARLTLVTPPHGALDQGTGAPHRSAPAPAPVSRPGPAPDPDPRTQDPPPAGRGVTDAAPNETGPDRGEGGLDSTSFTPARRGEGRSDSLAELDGGAGEPVPSVQLCERCERPLPGIPALRYCPFCGGAQGPTPCRECGTPMEGAWSFCVSCGTPRR